MATFSRWAVFASTTGTPARFERVAAGTAAFDVPASPPRLAGEPEGASTPEELLAASHATCFGIGLRSLIQLRGGEARRITVKATITAEKGPGGIRIQASHLQAQVEGLRGIAPGGLAELAEATERGCTISNALRGAVHITHAVEEVV